MLERTKDNQDNVKEEVVHSDVQAKKQTEASIWCRNLINVAFICTLLDL